MLPQPKTLFSHEEGNRDCAKDFNMFPTKATSIQLRANIVSMKTLGWTAQEIELGRKDGQTSCFRFWWNSRQEFTLLRWSTIGEDNANLFATCDKSKTCEDTFGVQSQTTKSQVSSIGGNGPIWSLIFLKSYAHERLMFSVIIIYVLIGLHYFVWMPTTSLKCHRILITPLTRTGLTSRILKVHQICAFSSKNVTIFNTTALL